MKRLLLNLFALAAASALLSGSAIAATKPNLIFINIDDLGYADIGCFGGQKARTPNVDRMAAEGMKFTSFYAAPVCTASRASLMTGCYARRVSMPGVLTPAKVIGLGKDEMTIAEALKPLGYNTMIIGKWHLGDQPEFLPTRRGFDHYFGLPYSNDMDGSEKAKQGKMPPLPLMRDETVIEAPAKQDELTARYA
ncbi:MAG: sulfatase-like hydrolase/transferase, partial [Akkermansiaceae bacterium]|nr:sulfatase-like hydrolase/transferase [Akkermansiaceae bacterium]